MPRQQIDQFIPLQMIKDPVLTRPGCHWRNYDLSPSTRSLLLEWIWMPSCPKRQSSYFFFTWSSQFVLYRGNLMIDTTNSCNPTTRSKEAWFEYTVGLTTRLVSLSQTRPGLTYFNVLGGMLTCSTTNHQAIPQWRLGRRKLREPNPRPEKKIQTHPSICLALISIFRVTVSSV